MTKLRLQVKLERTHRQEKRTTRLKNKRDGLAHRKKNPIYLQKTNYSSTNGNQTRMELRNRSVGRRQQIQHSHHAEIPIQNSQSHSKCTLVCNKSYSTYRLQHSLRDVIHERINKHHKNRKTIPIRY